MITKEQAVAFVRNTQVDFCIEINNSIAYRKGAFSEYAMRDFWNNQGYDISYLLAEIVCDSGVEGREVWEIVERIKNDASDYDRFCMIFRGKDDMDIFPFNDEEIKGRIIDNIYSGAFGTDDVVNALVTARSKRFDTVEKCEKFIERIWKNSSVDNAVDVILERLDNDANSTIKVVNEIIDTILGSENATYFCDYKDLGTMLDVLRRGDDVDAVTMAFKSIVYLDCNMPYFTCKKNGLGIYSMDKSELVEKVDELLYYICGADEESRNKLVEIVNTHYMQ